MKYKLLKSLGMVLLLAVAASGCQLINPNNTILQEDIEDAIELMGLIPIIEAAQEVTEPDPAVTTPSGFTIMTFNPTDTVVVTDDTPDALYTGPLGSPAGWGRWPGTGTFAEDIYGVPGNLGYLEISLYGGGAKYQVRFYVFPTLSPAVNYVYEEYYVMGGSWALVDSSGAPDPIAYIANKTYYFDGVVQDNSVEWTSGVTTTYFDTFSVPDDTASAAYDFPATVTTPAKGAVTGAVYSAHVESSYEDDDAGEVEATEFYTEVTDGDELRSAASYVTRNYAKSQLALEEKTVRRYVENITAETKTVRSRSTTELSIKRWSWTVESTERVDIAVNGSSLTTYDSVVEHSIDGETARITEISLVETAVDTNSFTGTMTITSEDESKLYSVSLDSTDGLTLTENGQEVGSFASHQRQPGQPVWVKLKKGEFTGYLIGQVLEGVYDSDLPDAEVTVGKGWGQLRRGNNTSEF